MHWIFKADRMNKDFFSFHRRWSSGLSIHALCENIGLLHTDLDRVLGIALITMPLFSADHATEEALAAQEKVRSCALICV